jgi:hypothetical protein
MAKRTATKQSSPIVDTGERLSLKKSAFCDGNQKGDARAPPYPSSSRCEHEQLTRERFNCFWPGLAISGQLIFFLKFNQRPLCSPAKITIDGNIETSFFEQIL